MNRDKDITFKSIFLAFKHTDNVPLLKAVQDAKTCVIEGSWASFLKDQAEPFLQQFP